MTSRRRPSRLTLGIDEAGRGPAIGPMVVAAVCVSTSAARTLSRAGVGDSKSFGAGQKARSTRAMLAELIRDKALYVGVTVVEPREIDARVCVNELNVLEREIAQALIEKAPQSNCIVADGERLFAPLAARYEHLIARNRAESFHAAVAAASIVAKTLRDALYEEIRIRYAPDFGEIAGGGYVNDGTRRFLRAYAARHGDLPPEARRSWPYDYLRDILGEDFDPRTHLADQARGQLGLFR